MKPTLKKRCAQFQVVRPQSMDGDWVEAVDKNTGCVYLYNRRTRESKWKLEPSPTKPQEAAQEEASGQVGIDGGEEDDYLVNSSIPPQTGQQQEEDYSRGHRDIRDTHKKKQRTAFHRTHSRNTLCTDPGMPLMPDMLGKHQHDQGDC